MCLPENFAFLGEQSTDALKVAGGLDGNLFQQYRQLAKQKGGNITKKQIEINTT